MTELLLKNSAGVLRLYKGWIDHQQHRNDIYEGKSITVYIADKYGDHAHSIGRVEKTSAVLVAVQKRFEAQLEKGRYLTVYLETGWRKTIAEYLKIRAERKAAKLAKKAKKLDAEQVEQKTAAIVSKVLAELQLVSKPTPSADAVTSETP